MIATCQDIDGTMVGQEVHGWYKSGPACGGVGSHTDLPLSETRDYNQGTCVRVPKMKGTTILLLGAATLVAYASALPYSKIPDSIPLPDAFNYKKSSSNSNSNSYSQSNHDETDVNGAYHGQTFTGSKSTGYNTNGGSHSQSSSFSSSSLNGNLPPGIFGFSNLPQAPINYGQSSLNYGNPGTAGLGLSVTDPGFSSGSYGSSYGNYNGGSSNSGGFDGQSTEGGQVLSGTHNAVIGSSESGVNTGVSGGSSGANSGHYGFNGDTSFSQTELPIASYEAHGNGYFGQAGSQPGAVQYWWNGPESPFGLAGKPSGGCSSNACSLAGSFDLSKGSAGGAQASNQGGQVGLNINSGNPFFSKGQGGAGSGFVSSGASFGQSGIASGSGINAGSGFNRQPIDGSHNPFFNGGYSGGNAGSGLNAGAGSSASSHAGGASSSSGSFASSSSNSFSGNGNPFLNPGSGSGYKPDVSLQPPTVVPGFATSQGSGFGNVGSQGSHNPFFKPGPGSVVITPPVAKFPDQSNQGFPYPSPVPDFSIQSTISNSLPTQQPTRGFPTVSPSLGHEGSTPGYSGISGSYDSAGDFQSQIGQVPSFSIQSTIGPDNSLIGYSTPSTLIPEQEPSRIDSGLKISCSGQGRICVLKGLCVNGRVSGNRPGLLQVRTENQLCDVDREVCCTLNEYSGSSTSFGGSQGSSFASSGSSSSSNSQSGSNYGGFSGSPVRPTLPTVTVTYPQSTISSGLFSSTENYGQLENSDLSGSSGSPGIFGQIEESGLPDTFDQSQQQESFNFDAQSDSKASAGSSSFGADRYYGGFSGSTVRPTLPSVTVSYPQSTISSGTPGPSVLFGSTNTFGQSGNSGQSGILGSSGIFGQNGQSNGYDQSQQQESIDFGIQSNSEATAGSGASLGPQGGSGFPSRFSPATPSPNLISVTPTSGFRKPTISSFGGGNSGYASAGASANAGASGQAGTGITGSFNRPSQIPSNEGSFTIKKPGQSNGGLFSSSDNSGEDLSAGEPSYTGSSSGILVGPAASNGYLPPIGSEPSDNVPAFSNPPKEDSKSTDQVIVKQPPPRQTFPPVPITVQVGCAAALICVEEKFCTLEGVISPQPVALTSQQIERRAPLSSCKNPDNGVIGKCCRDPNYVDPWPTGNLPANYSGGFDEQGFPSYLNYAKTHPAKKQPPVTGTKGGFRQPTKGFGATPKPTEKDLVGDLTMQFNNIVSNVQSWLPGQSGDTTESAASGTSSESYGDGASSPSTPADDQAPDQRPPFNIFGINIPNPFPTSFPTSFPNFPNPFANPAGSKTYDSSAIIQNPTIITPHTPGIQCGLRNKVQRPSDLDKDDVAFGEIPWQAMVLSTKDRKLLCSGAIVSPNAVLTSAHCVAGFKTGEVSIKAGEWKLGYELKHEEPLPFEIVKVSYIAPHPGFQSGSSSHDLAILFLEHPVKLDQHVDILCLGKIPQPVLGRKCIATGWGKVVLQVNVAGSLMHSIDVDIVPQEACKQRLQGAESKIEVDNTLTCVKPTNQRNNMCQVDVGGPLACDRGDGFYELTGIYSQETGCLPTNQVATFALIDTNWVKNSISSPPRVPFPSREVDLPYSEESSSSSNVHPNFGAQLQQPAPTCECQKSHLPAELNQYLPPV